MAYLENIVFKELKVNEKVTFHFNDNKSYFGYIKKTLSSEEYFISIEDHTNSIIFNTLGIYTKSFIKNLGLEYKGGDWPFVDSLDDLNKVLEALLKVNKNYNISNIIDRIGLQDMFNINIDSNNFKVEIVQDSKLRYYLRFHTDHTEGLLKFIKCLDIDDIRNFFIKRGCFCDDGFWPEALSIEGIKEQLKILVNEFPNINIIYKEQLYKQLQNSNDYEIKLQDKKPLITRGNGPEGNRICGRRSKTSVKIGHLSYSAASC